MHNQAVQNDNRKYLTFLLGNEEYGVSILKVKEIIGMMSITQIPQTESFVKGVINLRGKVIPVMDLRARFQMKEVDYTQRTCIIVMEILRDNDKSFYGVVVDAVSEVMQITEDMIEDAPAMGELEGAQTIMGMAKVKEEVRILLDVDAIVGDSAILSAAA